MYFNELKTFARSANSIGLHLYFIRSNNIQKMLEIQKPIFEITSHSKYSQETYILLDKKIKEKNIQKPFPEHVPYEDIIQEITINTECAKDDFYLSFSVPDEYFKHFFHCYKTNSKAVHPGLNISTEIFDESASLPTSLFVQFYNSIPLSLFYSHVTQKIYEELLKRPLDELEQIPQKELCKIFLKLKKHHGLASSNLRSKFESLFTDPDIIEKVKPYSSFLSDEPTNLQNYYTEAAWDKKVYFHLVVEDIKKYLSKPDFVIFQKTYINVLHELCEYCGYPELYVSYPSKGETLAIITAGNPTEELTAKKIWEYLAILYKLFSDNNLSIADIHSGKTVRPLLESYIMEQQTPINKGTLKPTHKF